MYELGDPPTHIIRLIEYTDKAFREVFPAPIEGYTIKHVAYMRDYRFCIDASAVKPGYKTEEFSISATIAPVAFDDEELLVCFYDCIKNEIQHLCETITEALTSQKLITTGGETDG